MLVFTRKMDESFFIGDKIKVTVVDIRGDKVRIGIEAPPEVRVDREEVRAARLSAEARLTGGDGYVERTK